jgi:hypothetical protein
MTMPLASCLPDFGTDDTPKHIEDHSEVRSATFKSIPGAPKPSAQTKTTKPIPAQTNAASDSKMSAAGNALKSVVRHIKLVEEPEFITPLIETPPPVDIDALLKEHSDKVRLEEAEKAKEALALAIAAERKAHEEARAKERTKWVEAESAQLAQQISYSLAELEKELSDSVARIFTPFLKNAVRDRAFGELRATIQELLNDAGQAKLEVCGPADLVNAIRDSLSRSEANRVEQITFTITNSTDVRVIAGNTVCATQLDAWNDRIANALSWQ